LWRRGSPAALDEITARERDIPIIYATTDTAIAHQLLNQYDVHYLFIGPTEQRLYGGLGLEKFDDFLQPVFQQGDFRIYRVPQG
jgi:uncharacterized membrane protein